MTRHDNPACKNCEHDAGIQCLSKVKKKDITYEKVIEDSCNVIFRVIECDQKKSIEQAT